MNNFKDVEKKAKSFWWHSVEIPGFFATQILREINLDILEVQN